MVVALGDRDPGYLTHREIDAALERFPAALDPRYVEPLERAGVVVGATAPDARVEAIELPEHPFFLATAFQPQVGASDGDHLAPLLAALVAATLAG